MCASCESQRGDRASTFQDQEDIIPAVFLLTISNCENFVFLEENMENSLQGFSGILILKSQSQSTTDRYNEVVCD